MAAKYNLQPDEVVVLKEENVLHGGFWAAYTDELILTNRNLVLLKKGVFGNPKGVLTFPVSQIKIYNDQAQAIIGKSSNGMDSLEIYFLYGQEEFRFQSGGKRKIHTWIAKINEVVTGKAAPDAGADVGMAIPGTELVAETLKDTINVFKSTFGASPSPTPVVVAGKCVGCGAALSGAQGQAMSCDYCGTTQHL